ncbi:hypothetical protein LTR86_007462 [Recurvomyces mirabilis]|nr:hypothetical protein LTR86_007462 [Recurvomyces mirabilis]
MRQHYGGQKGFEDFGSANTNGSGYHTDHGRDKDGSPRDESSTDPFGYRVGPAANGLPLGPSASQGNILNGNDETHMANFFDHLQDPDESQSLMQMGNNHAGLEHFGGLPFGENYGSNNYTFDSSNGTINPAVTLAGLPTSNVQTHLDTSHFAYSGPPPFSFDDLPEIFHSGVPGDVGTGAQLLANLANSTPTTGAQNTHPQGHGGAWGQLGNAHAFTGTHQQDLEGDVGLQNLASQAVMQLEPYASNMHTPSPIQAQNMHHNMNGFNGMTHARAQSAHEEYSASGLMFGQQNTHSASPAVRPQPRVPPMVRFGSDQQFGQGRHYQAAEYEAVQQEKMRNLMQVPLADRAAANGHARSPSQHMSPHEQRTAHMNNTTGFHNPFAKGNRDGHSTMAAPPRPGTAQWAAMTNGPTAAHSANVNGSLRNDAQSRKRRQSQMEREDEDEYVPEGQRTRATIPTRGPKVPKAALYFASEDEDEDEDDESDISMPAGKSAPKRRKSVANPRATDASSPNSAIDSHSPAGVESSVIKQRRPSGRSRANLTEEQKRQNHIHSEQKRRVVIKQGYQELEKLVPSLKNGKSGLSKSEQIKEIAAFIQATVKGNKRMKKVLQQMDQNTQPFGGYGGNRGYDDDADAGAGASGGASAGPSIGQDMYGGYSAYPPPQM